MGEFNGGGSRPWWSTPRPSGSLLSLWELVLHWGALELRSGWTEQGGHGSSLSDWVFAGIQKHSLVFAIATVSGMTLPGQSAGGKLSHPEKLNFHCQQNCFISVCVLTRPNFRDRKAFGYFS